MAFVEQVGAGKKSFVARDNGSQLGTQTAELCAITYSRKKLHRDVILIIPTVETTTTAPNKLSRQHSLVRQHTLMQTFAMYSKAAGMSTVMDPDSQTGKKAFRNGGGGTSWFRSRKPIYNPALGHHICPTSASMKVTSRFRPSVKNIVVSDMDGVHVLEVWRTGKDLFVVGVRHPLSVLQGFCCAITALRAVH